MLHAEPTPTSASIVRGRPALSKSAANGASAHTPDELEETRKVLVGLARGSFGAISPERIADHVLAVSEGADWPVRKAALSALARRYRFGERDELRVVQRPSAGVLGSYRTKSAVLDRRGEARPYETALVSLEPLRTSCSCPDFVRSSLGLCKHGLTVLDALEGKRKLDALRSRGAAQLPAPPRAALRPAAKATLSFSPWQPLRGSADRLARLTCLPAPRARTVPSFAHGRIDPKLLAQPGRRLALIEALERMLRDGALQAEPAVRTLLAEERARAERSAESAALVRQAMKSLSSLSRSLYPYQRAGVERFFASGRLLLADDMGLGKTTQAIAACHGLFATQRARRGLLIVPSALKAQWRREWEATTRTPLTLVDGSPDERARTYRAAKTGFLLIGYEQLLRDFLHVQRFSPELVVLDEAQRIKNWATKSAAYVKALSPRFRLVLTGTPMENRLDELASIMDFVDDVALEPKWRLAPFHDVYEGDGGRSKAGAQHLDVLRERLAGSMLRRVRREVLAQLPPRTDTRVPIEMTEPQRSAHEDLRLPIAVLAQKAARRPLTPPEFLRLMQLLTTQRMICNGMAQLSFDEQWPALNGRTPDKALLEGLFMPKLAGLRGLVEQVVLGQGRKAVVFSQWRKMLRLSEWAVRDLLRADGKRAVFFTGAESAALRERAIVDFHEDPSAAVMFLSDAGGVGLNLQRAASCCINLELPWNPAVLEQRIGRIYRLGQSSPVDVYNLVCEEGIEARIAAVVQQKSAVFSSLFDGTSDAIRFDGQSSFFKTLEKLVDPVAVPQLPAAELDDADGVDPRLGDDAAPAVAELDARAGEELPSATPALPPPAPVSASALAGLQVTRLSDGGLRIDAPPAVAAQLAELLESVTRALHAAQQRAQ